MLALVVMLAWRFARLFLGVGARALDLFTTVFLAVSRLHLQV